MAVSHRNDICWMWRGEAAIQREVEERIINRKSKESNLPNSGEIHELLWTEKKVDYNFRKFFIKTIQERHNSLTSWVSRHYRLGDYGQRFLDSVNGPDIRDQAHWISQSLVLVAPIDRFFCTPCNTAYRGYRHSLYAWNRRPTYRDLDRGVRRLEERSYGHSETRNLH